MKSIIYIAFKMRKQLAYQNPKPPTTIEMVGSSGSDNKLASMVI